MSWTDWANGQLAGIDSAGRRRTLRSFDAHGPTGTIDGRPVVSFASNDYLGLSVHPKVVAAAHDALDRWGTGATASRLVVGTRPCHAELEERWAAMVGAERALVCASGYATNLAVLTTVGGPGVTVLSDELNHASIIDGCRLARADVGVFRHADPEHLGRLLSDVDGPTVVVTDSVFSMDGDHAPLEEIADLCLRHGALLVLDEAHGVLGPWLPAVDGLDVLRVGTLSKALGALGGVVAGPAALIELIVNQGRSFIFSTGLTPADTAAALAALDIVGSDEGERLRRSLRRNIDRVRPGHPTPIVPIVLGEESAAVAAASRLLAGGLLVPAIRPPTVPPGTSRLRVALSAAHDEEMIDRLCAALGGIGGRP